MCWPITPSWLALECGWYAQQCYFAENWFFLSQQVAIATHSWVRGWTLCLSPLLSAGALPGLDLCWSSVYGYSPCVFLCLSVFLCLEDTPPLTLSGLSMSSAVQIPEPWSGRGLIKAEFRAECSKVFLTLYTVLLWISVLITIDWKKQLPWWGLSDAWICEDSNYKRKKS